MTPEVLNAQILTPALQLLGARFDKFWARVELVAVALQESSLEDRIQQPNGPARSYWQFERGGGVHGVLTHPATSAPIKAIAWLFDYPADEHALHLAMTDNDLLAACFARLLLFTDPRPLPQNADDGWAQYVDCWGPGKPRPHTWPANWALAEDCVTRWTEALA